MAGCYTRILAGGPRPYKPYKMLLDKVYNIPRGWIWYAKNNAKTALALIY